MRKELVRLGVDRPVGMVELCRVLGESRGRAIRLVPFPMEVPGPYGLWMSTASADYIVFQAETTKVHQEHIIAHELGHILAGHQGEEDDEEIWARLMPDIAPGVLRRLLKRTHYDSAQEREAETIATLLLERSLVAGLVTGPGHSLKARRMQRALGDSRSWL
ncbi:hypothetical protein [Amycolatopsis sp. lyj-112]|uniref:hypothetical protein n=1 Tax=Amycolatopsis sp. lyj-112 TaxID=2789288 RepID=UPI003979B3B8